MQNCLVGVVLEVSRQHANLNAFAKQLMGGASHMYGYIQTCDVKVLQQN